MIRSSLRLVEDRLRIGKRGGCVRIAVIGAGIAGLGAAWLLSSNHDVVLIEGAQRAGGHSNTVDVQTPEGPIPVDTGFIVYNTASYPNLIALFDRLGVPTAATRMGFACSLDDGRFEYNGNGLGGFFGQPANLLSPAHWAMGRDILRFFREARAMVADGAATPAVSLGRWLHDRGYSQAFIERHILPMAAAIWSAPANRMLEFPVAAFARFFSNHGLLQATGRPEWRTVAGGSREYVRRLLGEFKGRLQLGDAAVSVSGWGAGVRVATMSGAVQTFDRCLVACHADEALGLLGGRDGTRAEVLSAFHYSANDAVLHTDPNVMPRRRRLWCAWNYSGSGPERVAVTYWMNELQPLKTTRDIFVSLNPGVAIDETTVSARIAYRHPLFDRRALLAQRQLWPLQGRDGIWLAGSYFGYGFHEDALQAGLAAAEAMGAVRRPWLVAGENDRLTIPDSPVKTTGLAGAA